MSDRYRVEAEPVRFGERLAASQAFSALFRDGMALVEETASYLDGSGRKEAKELPRQSALAYATESMRLTTRLMQLASWLLLHRAVNEGEMSLGRARKEKTKVKIVEEARDPDVLTLVPERLAELIDRSLRMQSRIRHLDAVIHEAQAELAASNPVGQQLGLLRAAFPADAG